MTAASSTTETRLLDAARALAPDIRAAADEAERGRCLPRPLVQELRDAGLFRMWLPEAIGGYALHPVNALRVVEELARADGSVAWCVTVAAHCALHLPSIVRHVAAAVFTGDDILAGALAGGRAEAVAGGYRATGRWSFASGCTHATWIMGTCDIVEGGEPRILADGTVERRTLYFRRNDCRILDTWHTLGLRGTGSHDYTIEDVFVPADLAPLAPPAGWRDRWGGPLYRGPFIWSMRGGLALGIARHALDAFAELAANKKPFGGTEPLRDLPRVQAAVARAEASLAAARAYVHDTVGEIWDSIIEERADPAWNVARAQLAGAYTSETCLQVVDTVFRLAGATAIYTSSPLERCFRDINTLMADQAVAPRVLEAAGHAYLHADNVTGIS